MHADEFPAFGTGPFFLLITDKVPDTRSLDHIEILDHAHAILLPVSLIQSFQPGTGKFATAFRAIGNPVSGIVFAILKYTGGSVLRTRPIFPVWELTFTLNYAEDVVNIDQIKQVVEDGGRLVGLCDWKPKFGRYELIEFKEI